MDTNQTPRLYNKQPNQLEGDRKAFIPPTLEQYARLPQITGFSVNCDLDPDNPFCDFPEGGG